MEPARSLTPPLMPGLVLLVLVAVSTPLAAQSQAGSVDAEGAANPLPLAEIDRDRVLEDRLAQLFGQIGDLSEVEVEVRAGVVRLDGVVRSPEARHLARRLAWSADGVVAVDDRLTVTRRLGARLEPVLERVEDRLLGLVAVLPLLAVALLVLLAFLVAAYLVGRWEALFGRLSANPFVQNLLRLAVRTLLILTGLVLALEVLDATALLGAVLGSAGLIGLALGFAFRDTAENTIASILLSLRQPFAPNDQVIIEGHEGRVVRLTSRATWLLTLDGNHVRIPNSTVFKSIMVNLTRSPRRRLDFQLGVGTGEDLRRVLERCRDVLAATEGVLAEPPPAVWVRDLGDSSVTLHLSGWVDQRRVEFIKVRGEAIRRVKEALDAAGIEMPEPTFRVLRAVPPEHRRTPSEGAALDVTPDTGLDRQVARDRATAPEADLLDPEAPRE